jgi:rieske iron-sulfur protein
MLKGAVVFGAALVGATGTLGLADLAFAQDDAAKVRPREGDLLVKVDDAAMTALSSADIPIGEAPTMAWAMDPESRTVRSGSKFNEIVLVRLDDAAIGPETKPLAAAGVVAYAATCTHSGCEVGEWLEAEHVLHCACHSSKFDPGNAARVVDGPAPRSLPALPLKVVDQKLVVAGAFTTRVGYDAG